MFKYFPELTFRCTLIKFGQTYSHTEKIQINCLTFMGFFWGVEAFKYKNHLN